jgi:integrase
VPRREKLHTKTLTQEEVDTVFKTINEPIQYMLFWIGVNYGIRADEIINLELDDVDLTAQILCIKADKGLKEREIPILDDHLDVWRKWFQLRLEYRQSNHSYVFFASTGRFQIRNLQRYYNRMSEAITPIPEHLNKKGLNKAEEKELKAFKKNYWFGSHDLLRTFATNLYNGDLDILVISKMLGHNSLTTTQHYLRVEKNKIQDAYRNHFNGGA